MIAALTAAGLTTSPATVMAGTVACTGNQAAAAFLPPIPSVTPSSWQTIWTQHFHIDQPINLHVTGCPNSCAQHYIGDIGLLGATVGGEEGYQVFIGGGSDQDQAIARELLPAINFNELPEAMNRLFAAFTKRRNEGESFLEFSRRHETAELKNFCAGNVVTQARSVPLIPEDAPFTPAQRAWLNGFIVGMFAPAAPPSAPAAPMLEVAVLFGSQSGTAEGAVKKDLSKNSRPKGMQLPCHPSMATRPRELASKKYAVLIVSTYGDGDPPDNVQPFYEQLCLQHLPYMQNLSYAVLALGDSHYEHFCQFRERFGREAGVVGCNPLSSGIDCDVDLDQPFAASRPHCFRNWISWLRRENRCGGETGPKADSPSGMAI